MPTVIFPAIPVRDTNGEPLIALRGQSGTIVSRGTTTPLTLVDVHGLPMAQPLVVTSLGFLPTFGVVEGLEEADFVSGAVRMPIDSPTGLRDSARESAASAAGARTAAEVAAGNASASVTAALSNAVASAEAAQAAAEDAAALVGAPADAAIATAVSGAGTATRAALDVTYGRNASVWTPTGTNGVTNRTSLQSAVTAAIAAGNDLLLNATGIFDIDGTVNVAGKVRIFGLGREVTTVHQIAKPIPSFYVTGENVTFEDFTGSGDGPSFNVGAALFQNYNVIRVERGAHGFSARRLGFADHYIGILFRNYPNDPASGVGTAPVRTARVIIDDITADGVWAAIHGGPFDSPTINNIRGRYVRATGHGETEGHAPHLVYINAPNPADGNRTDAYYTKGGTITNLSAWDGPDYVGAAFSFKYMRGTQIDNLTARSCRGVIEMMGMEDCSFGMVNSVEDKYPGTGADATRASVSFNTSARTKIHKLTVDFAAVDHGRAVRMENGSSDNEVENLTVIERGTVARNTGNPNGDIGYAVHLQGSRNTVRNADITNLGMPKWCAFSVSGTGEAGRIISPRVRGIGYDAHIRVAAAHTDAIIDYDPLYLTLDRAMTSTRLSIDPGARAIIRDRSVGQILPPGFVDEFERGATVNGLAATDDGKTWLYRDSGIGNPASWQIHASGYAKYVGAGARALAVVDGVSANGTLHATVGSVASGEGSGVAFRIIDWNNFIGVGFNYGGVANGKVNLFKRVAGVRSDIAQSAALGLIAADSVIEVVLAGTAISVRVDGVETIGPQTITDFLTATTHGLLHQSTETSLTWKRVEFTAA